MLASTKHYFLFALLVGYLLFPSCLSIKSVPFETTVDTSNRSIEQQTKQTFYLEALGIYASNEFDAARLNGFEQKNDSTVLLIIEPENEPINHSPYYAFSTWADSPKTIYYSFKYPAEYEHRYPPKIKIGEEWELIDPALVSLQDSLVTIKLVLNKAPSLVAAQEIQATKDVINWYKNLVAGKQDFVKVASAGTSIQGQNIPVLDIYKGEKKEKDLIVLMTRQHPPEVTGYFAFQHFLETILDDSQLANDFLEEYRVIAFPLINPDGVDLGHWRHNAAGVDTNRDWSNYQQKEIRQVVKFISRKVKKNKLRILLGLDFHSTYEDVFYTNERRDDTTLPNFIEDWFASLEKSIPNYKVNEKAGNSTKPVSKGWFLYGHDAVGITYEIGDKTPKTQIEQIGKVSAQEMMKLLLLEKSQASSIPTPSKPSSQH